MSPAPADGFITPKIKAQLKALKIDMDDPHTLAHLESVYAANRAKETTALGKARANSGEFRALIREAGEPKARSARFLKPSNKKDDFTPDIEVTMMDGTRKFVEVRTITGAWPGKKLSEAAKTHAPVSAQIDRHVEDKIRRGQISETHPGKIVFHAPFQKITGVALKGWRNMLKGIRKNGAFPEGLESIEVTGAPDKDGAMKMLIFKPPRWKGVIVK